MTPCMIVCQPSGIHWGEALRLDQYLPTLEAQNRELAERVARIRQYVRDKWEGTVLLPEYTDHGPQHSERVADYALQLIPDVLQPNTELRPVEGFALCSAALLHDIGMQVQPVGSALGEPSQATYKQIRNLHPEESYNLIIQQWHTIGIPDDPQLITVVALLARSHGTHYFVDSVARLQQADTVGNEPFRGPLLAGVLLMADELDLYYKRASRAFSEYKLSTVSRAHNFRHHYVTSSTVRHDQGEIRIRLVFDFPKDMNSEARRLIQRWTVIKLKQQIGLVHPFTIPDSNGQIRFSRRIDVLAQNEVAPVRRIIDAEAVAVIREDVARQELSTFQLR
jgi:hypothetical protein